MQAVRKKRLLYGTAWFLLLAMVFVAVFGSYLMPHEITEGHRITFLKEVVNGETVYRIPPFPPSDRFWLGTDHRGYDLLSLLLNGAKYTLGFALAVVVCRFLIALPLGLFAGVTGKGRGLIAGLQLITSSVPALLFVFPTMYGLTQTFHLNGGATPDDPKVVLFAVILFALLVFLGVFQLAHQFRERADYYSGRLFVSVARTMGASSSRIMFRHLLPHLRPEVAFAFVVEIVQVLFLLGQLAVVNIFLGGGQVLELDSSGAGKLLLVLTTVGEWGGLTAYGAHYIREYPWIIFGSGLFFTLSILTMQFFSSQLQARLSQPAVFKGAALARPKPRFALIGTVVAACLLLVLFGQSKAPDVSSLPAKEVTSGQVPTQEPSPQDDAKRVEVKQTAAAFVNNLVDGNWAYAFGYYQDLTGEVGTKQAPKPFDRWIEAFREQGYAFDGIGELQDTGNQMYQAEVRVSDKQGQSHVWKLRVGGPRVRVWGGEGDPVF
ncbi:MAG TPA: ABC transporter permease subunit [Bacilli bacterium]|nr:ABC transporter permease subunit [Bacilli bacterium]